MTSHPSGLAWWERLLLYLVLIKNTPWGSWERRKRPALQVPDGQPQHITFGQEWKLQGSDTVWCVNTVKDKIIHFKEKDERTYTDIHINDLRETGQFLRY